MEIEKTKTVLPPARTLTEQDLGNSQLSTMERAMILRSPMASEVCRELKAINGRPLGDKIFVLPLPPDERHGSIIIPENTRDEQHCGIVVAVGRGHYENGVLIAPEVGPGNYVVYSKYAGRTVQVGNVSVQQISECDITFAVGE
jgi:chaperonin GroES